MSKKVSDEVYAKTIGRTICEVHRELYDSIHTNLKDHPEYDDLTFKLQEAYTMAKKMDAKLRQYANNYDEGWWEQEKQAVIEEKLKTRKSRNK